MKIFQEFKSFALRGNVIDLAVGVIIGAAFSSIIASLVTDVFNPILGLLTNGVSFENAKWIIQKSSDHKPEVAILYGKFIQTIIQFLIVAFIIFLLVKTINKLQKKHDNTKPPVPSEIEKLLAEIRDTLKNNKI